ncbi:MAG: homoserine kinase [Cyclobacteriaceae bacterium]
MDDKASVTVFAPSTVANVGCGYDILGLALNTYGDTITLAKTEGQLEVRSIKGAVGLPMDPKQNVATVAIQSMLDELNSSQGFVVEIEKNIAPGSGLGSSASSSAAAVFAANELLGRPYTRMELVRFAMEGERAASGVAHADNVAPSLLGGFTVVRGYDPLDVFTIPYPEELQVVIFFPQLSVKTSDAKRILKHQINLQDAVTQWGNIAGLVSGLIMKDFDLIGRSLQDVIVEPVRSILIPFYDEVKSHCLEKGALGFNISGSGPSMFALSNNETLAHALTKDIMQFYKKYDIELMSFVSTINHKGAEIIQY